MSSLSETLVRYNSVQSGTWAYHTLCTVLFIFHYIRYGLKYVCSWKFLCWNPDSPCDAIRKSGLGWYLGSDDGALLSGVGALIRKTRVSLCFLSLCHLQDTERNWLAASREAASPQTLDILVSWCWASQTLELGTVTVCCLSHLVNGILLQQCKQTKKTYYHYLLDIWLPQPPGIQNRRSFYLKISSKFRIVSGF